MEHHGTLGKLHSKPAWCLEWASTKGDLSWGAQSWATPTLSTPHCPPCLPHHPFSQWLQAEHSPGCWTDPAHPRLGLSIYISKAWNGIQTVEHNEKKTVWQRDREKTNKEEIKCQSYPWLHTSFSFFLFFFWVYLSYLCYCTQYKIV
jgi:hypothetical protein